MTLSAKSASILLVFIDYVTKQSHIINEECHFFQIIVCNIVIISDTEFVLEFIHRIRWIDYRNNGRYIIEELGSLCILEHIVFNGINEDDVSVYFLGFIDQLFNSRSLR